VISAGCMAAAHSFASRRDTMVSMVSVSAAWAGTIYRGSRIGWVMRLMSTALVPPKQPTPFDLKNDANCPLVFTWIDASMRRGARRYGWMKHGNVSI